MAIIFLFKNTDNGWYATKVRIEPMILNGAGLTLLSKRKKWRENLKIYSVSSLV
ncbi:hypothetical protein SALWKB12_0760 [Snodgrassella communis]|uniref:Uncharacterized protein n=1 Tax=Snodgrassella communis TaxID=2946699 RepID=A0A836MQG7_9NEIS|nr:hypothetical protein SALWKB12_0760 [Snodgrassella communis]KDN15261.1 hypothetical protein SALWKB29_0887 [Snodgrassella communis]